MTKFFKVEITTTVLFSADSTSEANNRISNMSLIEIAEEMDSGDMIGKDIFADVVEIPRNEIESEEVAVGGDGTFFNVDEDEDEEEEHSLEDYD